MWYLYLATLAAGVANAVEPGQNATLAKALGQPGLAGLVCFGLALAVFLAGMVVLGRVHLPHRDRAARAPWWAWPGGLLGGGIVLIQISVSEKIGAAPFLGLVVTAGVIGSIGLDHFGLVGFERHPAGRCRIAGGALMIAGVGLVALT